MCTFYFFRPMTVTQKKLWQVCLHLLAWWICPQLTNTKSLSIISWILQWTQWTYIHVTTHEGIGELTSASLPSVTLPNQELLAPNFQISHCYLTEKMSTSAVVPTVFTTHQVSSSFRRNAAIDKDNLSVIISYICQWEKSVAWEHEWHINVLWYCLMAVLVAADDLVPFGNKSYCYYCILCIILHGQHWCK